VPPRGKGAAAKGRGKGKPKPVAAGLPAATGRPRSPEGRVLPRHKQLFSAAR
jgi:hypothetical protein